MTATIVLRIDRLHEARCIAAIRERKMREAKAQTQAWFSGRDARGRYARVELAA